MAPDVEVRRMRWLGVEEWSEGGTMGRWDRTDGVLVRGRRSVFVMLWPAPKLKVARGRRRWP
jgi:hypothetical protein